MVVQDRPLRVPSAGSSGRAVENARPNRAPENGGINDLQQHPSGGELHDYFSRIWGQPLSTEARAEISRHVTLCNECADIGKGIQEDDQILELIPTTPLTAEDEVNQVRAINVFWAEWEKEKRKEQKVTQPENAETPEMGDLWLTEPSDSWLMTLEMVDLIPELAEAVRLREIPRAVAIVERNIKQLETIPLLQPGAMHLLAYCAWAIDYFGPYFDQVKRAVARFRCVPRKDLTLQDFALLNLAEGLVKFHEEEYGEAEILFKQALGDADRAEDQELMTVLRYYRGRALWKLRSYDLALDFIRDAISRDLAVNNQARVAAMELVEGWLLFLKGKINLAQTVLGRARARLGQRSDTWVELGNIVSFQGRLYREAGPEHYMNALDCFAEAITIYSDYDRTHRNVARSHFNAAFVYRLLARDLGNQRVSAELRDVVAAEIDALRSKAFTELEQARRIYDLARDRHTTGLSKAHSLLALLSFDVGDFDSAEKEAETSYFYAGETGYYIGMANARIIQSKVVLERGLNGYEDVNDALRLAREAIAFAEKTENRRVIARSYLREGHALLELPEPDLWGARRSLEAARRRLVSEDRDYVSKSLAELDKLIEEAGRSKRLENSVILSLTSESLKQEISAGHSLGDISEAFEERIARFVCTELCDGNITRAGELLKTGARKVRKAVSSFLIDDDCLELLAQKGVPDRLLNRLASFKGREIQGQANFVRLLKEALGSDLTDALESILLAHVNRLQSRRVDTEAS